MVFQKLGEGLTHVREFAGRRLRRERREKMTLQQMKEYWEKHSVAGNLLRTGQLPEGVDASTPLPEASTQRLADLVGQFAQQQGRFTAGDLAALFTESAHALRPLAPALAPEVAQATQE